MMVMVSVLLLATIEVSWGQTYKIMPLGDSITKGDIGSATPGGYRDDLKNLLTDEIVSSDFVGSLSNGSFADPEHEGHDGATVDYVDANITTWISNAVPDFVLLMVGTNDLGTIHINTIAEKISGICNKIHDVNDNITIFLSSILPRGDNASKDSLAIEANRLIKRVVVNKLSSGFNIYYVGNNELFKNNPDWATEYMHDGIHPNDLGYNLIAQLFWSAIMNVIKNDGVIVTDNFNRSMIGIAWEYDPAFELETISSGQRELNNTSNESRWDMMAVYKAIYNPGEVSIRWGRNASLQGIENAGLALRLNRAGTNANGYLLRIKENGILDLWTIVNGNPDQYLTEAPGATPAPNQVFTVVLSSDAAAHHFHCYIDGSYVGTVSDFEKIRGNEPQLFAGVMLRGSLDGSNSLENNIDDFNLYIVGDIVPPARINNLSVASTTNSTVSLNWTAPGDDSLSDQASYYDIRYSKEALTDDNWNDATKVMTIEAPKAPSSLESIVVPGLESDVHYYFGIKTADEEYNWSELSNVVDATTIGGPALQKSDDFDDPNTLTEWWSANPVYAIQSGEMVNTSTLNDWGHLAVFKVNVNPIEASISWSPNATSVGTDKGALALLLDTDNYTTANGYLAWIRTQVGDDPALYLFTIKAGTPDVFLGTSNAAGLKKPGPGDAFKVAVSSDGNGHHFDYYVNEIFYGRLDDPAKTYSDGTDYYMGIELHGNLNNNVDRFVTVNTVGDPEIIEKVKPLGIPTGIVGKPLSDSLIIRVTDKSGNPIGGLDVNFTVTQGGGHVDITQKDNYVRIEAENANPLESPMEIGVDPGASNSQYIFPNGGEALEGKADFNFYVKEAGSYVIWCRMALPNTTSLSLFVQVDDNPQISAGPPEGVWDFKSYEPGPWEWRVVTDRASEGNVASFNLSKGVHKLTITQRVADYVKIDKILLSNNYNYVPSGLEDVPQYMTDSNGQARAQFTLGTVAGENRVEAIVPGYTLTGAPATFIINGNADTPVSIVATPPTSQSGVGGQQLSQPFEVNLKDQYGNAAANYEITFTVTEGDGFLSNGQTTHLVKSDNDGKASTYLTLGTEFANNKLVASFGSLPSLNFMATATSGIANAMKYESGNSQSAKVGTTLPNPLKVKIEDSQGKPVVNHNVKFQLTAGGGSLVPTSLALGNKKTGESMPFGEFLQLSGSPTMDVLTNNEGFASVRLVVGFVAGINTVQATSNSGGAPLTPIEFNVTSIPDIPDTLIMADGNNQTGAAGMQLSKPFVVKVADQFDNPIYGHKVQFAVIAGDGFLDGNTDQTKSVITDPEGKAQVFLILGDVAGVSNQVTAESYIGEELIVNPGFEVVGTGGVDVFANWIVEQHGASTVNDETAQVHGGSHACRINVVSGTDYHTTIIQDVSLNVNQEYELSWWGKISGETEFAYFIKNEDTQHWWKEATQEWVESYSPNSVTMTTDYQNYSVRFIRESSGTNYQIHFRPSKRANHIIYLDDVSLTLYIAGGGSLLGQSMADTKKIKLSHATSLAMISGVTPLSGSPVTFSATAGFVTSIQPKSPTSNLVGSAGTALDDSLEVYVKDNYDNPVGGYPVKFSSINGDNPGTFNGHTWHEIDVLTDSYGIARVAFYCGNKPGIQSQSKAIADGLTGSPIDFNVSVTELAKFEYVDGDSQAGLVGSVLPKPLKAKVVDQRGKPIPGFDVIYKIIEGGGKIAGDSVAVIKSDTTTKVAAAEFKLGPTPGTNNNIVEASVIYKDKPLPGSPIRYTASSSIGEPTELVEVSGNYQRTVVGSPLEYPIVVMVGDAYRNPYSSRPVTFTVKAGGGYLDGDSTKKSIAKNTDNNGKAQVLLTVGRSSGQNNNEVEVVSFKAGTQTHLTNSPMIFYASGTASAAHTLETVSGTAQPRSPVRQALPQPFVVKVKDRDDNPVPDHPVRWEIPQGNGSFDGLTDSIKTVPTNADGISQVYYYPGPIAGLQNIVRAHSWNQVPLNGSPRTFAIDTKEGPVSAKNSLVTATSPVLADGESKSTIVVTLQDDWGNKIANKVVGFLSVSGSNNIQSGFWNPADAKGQAEGYLASKKAEVKVIKMRDITDGINLEDTAKVRFTPLKAHSIGYVSGTDQMGNFGTVVRNPIKAIVVDINGNPIPSHPVLFEAYEGGGYIWEHQGLGAPFVHTDENGIASANWVMGPSAEVNRARAIATGLVGSGDVRYIATAHEGKPHRMNPESVNSQSGTAGWPLNDPFIVKVVDENNDPIFDYPVKFKVEYGGGKFNGSSVVTIKTNPFGQASQILILGKIAGSNVVSVEAPALLGSPIGFTAQGFAGDAAKVVKWAGEGKNGPVGGTINGIQVKVTDIFDNAVSGYTVNFAVNKGSANINGSGAVTTGPDGIASVGIVLGQVTGEIEIIVGTPGLIGDGLITKVYAVASSAVSMQIYHGNEQKGTIERELVYPFSVLVLDQYGNPAGGQNVPVSFVRIEGNGMLLDGPTVTADENGIASARFQLGNLTGESYKVWAINNNLTGSPLEFKASGVTNKYPIIAPIQDATVRENQNISFKVNATDDDQDPVRYGIRNLPAGASYDSLGTKRFNWTPSYFQAGKHIIHFMAWDNKDGFDDEPVTVNVENVNRMPQITYYEPISTQLVGHKEIGETFRFLVQVSDPDNDELTYEWYDNGILVSIKNSYDFYVADENLGTHTIIIKVFDGYDTVERNWELFVKVPVQLAHFSGLVVERKGVELKWETTVEVAHAGFNLLRKSSSDADYQQVNKHLIRSDCTNKYSFIDRNITVGEAYNYKLEDVSISGEKTQHDPITVFVARPKDYKLFQNYPNPFNPTTRIEYQLPKPAMLTIKIYNTMGQEVKTLVDEAKEAGYHAVIWNGLDNSGTPVASGVYYYRLVTKTFTEVKKMVLLR